MSDMDVGGSNKLITAADADFDDDKLSAIGIPTHMIIFGSQKIVVDGQKVIVGNVIYINK